MRARRAGYLFKRIPLLFPLNSSYRNPGCPMSLDMYPIKRNDTHLSYRDKATAAKGVWMSLHAIISSKMFPTTAHSLAFQTHNVLKIIPLVTQSHSLK